MKHYTVSGMSCAACAARVEKAVSAVPGVDACSVSLLTGTMIVEGNADDDAVIRAVTAAGYGASVPDGKAGGVPGGEILTDRETPRIRKRLLISLVFLFVLMYFSMGHHMWGWPVPAAFDGNPKASGLLQMVLAAVIMLINNRFFVSGVRSVLHGAPNMDTLVSLGSSASFIWSVYALIMTESGELYFESAAMILALITVGKLLEAKSKGRTTDALKSLIRLAPKTARVVRENREEVVPAEEVRVGDIFLVKPGESIPVDGVVLEGSTAVNEAALTGESVPVDKAAGDGVYAATVSGPGFIRCRAVRVGEDTTLSQIIKLVSDAAASKAPIAKTADRVSAVFVPVVLAIALCTLAAWLIIGRQFDFALARAVSVLVISCPCALGLATPVAITVGSGVGAKHGILFKTAASLEETGKVGIVVLDKTGTVTSGCPEVTGVYPADVSEDELLSAAYALESRSEHPFAGAIVREAEKRDLTAAEVTDFTVLPGSGLTAVLGGERIYGGSAGYIASVAGMGSDTEEQAAVLADSGNTPLVFTKGGRLLGIIAVADTVRQDSRTAVAELEGMGIRTVMLTGDNPRTAAAVAEQAGIGHVAAGVLPQDKAKVIAHLREFGKVAMVGDGINDAPALTEADIGIAIGAGTDVAIEAADVVLMNSRLSDAVTAIALSRATLRNIRENLFWAFFYNVLCIPLAAGCYIGLFGLTLNPTIGAAAMSLSSFCVVMNALRLNLFKVSSRRTRLNRQGEVESEVLKAVLDSIEYKPEVKTMTKTIRIEGMMCPHCEAHTQQALEAVDGVVCAEASHVDKRAVVTLNADVSDEILKEAVEKAGYTVLGIE